MHYLLLANLPATGCTLRSRPPTILQPLPLRYLYQYVNFAVPYLFKTLQRYGKYLKRASILENKCLFVNVYYNYNVYLGYFVNIYKHFITIIYNYNCL